MTDEQLNTLCQTVADEWVKNGAGYVLFEINAEAISVFIEEKRMGLTVLSSAAETWWQAGGTKESFLENADKIFQMIKEKK